MARPALGRKVVERMTDTSRETAELSPTLRRPGPRFITCKGASEELIKRVLYSPPGSVISITAQEMRQWRDTVIVING